MKGKRRWTALLMGAGGLFLVAALLLTVYNLLTEWRAGEQAQEILEQLEEQLPEMPTGGGGNPDEESVEEGGLSEREGDMPILEIGGNSYIGILEIPALDLTLPVMGQWNYPNLNTAPCRYCGSAYDGDLVIAGHNYRPHFGLLYSLETGAEVVFTDVEGSRFYYEVAETTMLEPTAVGELLGGQWDLSLFTCDFSGQARVTVRCVRAEGERVEE